MLPFDAIRLQTFHGKVLEVERHDGLRTGADGGGENVTIVGVRQREPGDQVVEALDHTIRHRSNHELARAGELRSREVGALLEDVREALIEDHRRPPRADDARSGEPNEQVAQRRGVENARVVDDDERHGSVTEPVLLRPEASSSSMASRSRSSRDPDFDALDAPTLDAALARRAIRADDLERRCVELRRSCARVDHDPHRVRKLRGEAVHLERRQEAHDRERHAGAHLREAMKLGHVGVGMAIQPTPGVLEFPALDKAGQIRTRDARLATRKNGSSFVV